MNSDHLMIINKTFSASLVPDNGQFSSPSSASDENSSGKKHPIGGNEKANKRIKSEDKKTVKEDDYEDRVADLNYSESESSDLDV